MIVIIQQVERLGVVDDDAQERLGFVAGEVAPFGDVGNEPHRLLELTQAVLVDGVSLDAVVPEDVGCPDAKLCPTLGVNPVPD